MSEAKKKLAPGMHPDPCWHEAEWDPDKVEEWIIEWRERHGLAFFEIAEMCGLVRYRRSRPEETMPEERSQDRVERVFDALKTLVEIDPDGRR